MYFLLRIFRRQSGSVGIADLLVIVVIADAAQNGMAGDSDRSQGLILITTIVLWDFFFDRLGFKPVMVGRVLEPNPLLIDRERQDLEKESRKGIYDRGRTDKPAQTAAPRKC